MKERFFWFSGHCWKEKYANSMFTGLHLNNVRCCDNYTSALPHFHITFDTWKNTVMHYMQVSIFGHSALAWMTELKRSHDIPWMLRGIRFTEYMCLYVYPLHIFLVQIQTDSWNTNQNAPQREKKVSVTDLVWCNDQPSDCLVQCGFIFAFKTQPSKQGCCIDIIHDIWYNKCMYKLYNPQHYWKYQCRLLDCVTWSQFPVLPYDLSFPSWITQCVMWVRQIS